ncbi:Ig-like domain-containing protein [Kitasatospora sp. GP82]|uniref:L,D-transpeptidase n=1 Tax=Kitasatospora sp. GP82 TaxID=3035089 RepID=UPI002476FED7|nr:Ig-like domain-containing protein [Kitasatospora sp. GP82]
MSSAAKPSAAVLSIEPKDGAQGVAPSGALKVSVASGKLTNVAVTDKSGKPVAGAITGDGLSWTPTVALAVGVAYHVSAEAADTKGAVTTASSGFTTLAPDHTVTVEDNIVTGEKFGVGMIVSVEFGGPVKNRADLQKAITVEASDDTEVKGHWFGDTRLDLRPEHFWKPGTTVKVHFRTKNVEVSPGVYGATDRDEQFTIGRSKVSEVDAAAHTMVVKKDGAPDQTVPITAGADDNPSWNGTMVVSEKNRMQHMDSRTVVGLKGPGYIADDPHALRLTSSGTFLHGNPKAADAIARGANISHGCVGLPDTPKGDDNSPAGKFYADSIIGDVVTVRHSVKTEPLEPFNGLSGWNLPWSKW